MRYTALLFAALAGPLHAQDAITALQRAERAYQALETLEAEFTQVIVNPMLGGPELSQGILFLEPPSRFAMRFSDPVGDRIVADGVWLWAFTPSSVPDQVIRQAIPKRGAATPNLLAQFMDRPLEHYRPFYVEADTVAGELVDVVRLIPRFDDAPFREATISVSRTSGLLRRIALREVSGQQRTLVFVRLRDNVAIPDAELRFTVPSGVRVVTPGDL